MAKCRVSGKTVTWIPRETWVSGETVVCLCGAAARFRVRGADLPGHARILTHDAKDETYGATD